MTPFITRPTSTNIIIILFVSVVLPRAVSIQSTTTSPRIKLRVNHHLPPDIHRLFNVTIQFVTFHKVSSALIVYLVNKTGQSHDLIDKFVFLPGSEIRMAIAFKGKHMSVPYCVSKSSDRLLELHIRFNASAQNTTCLIYYADDYNPELKKPTAVLIYEATISCNISANPNIKLTMGTNDVNEPAFLVDQTIWINCSATAEHEPKWRRVLLEGLDDFDILKQEIANHTLMSSIYTTATIKNHGKIIVCRSMAHSVSRILLIYHHPKSVYTVPAISSWSTIPNNVSIVCKSTGGYPPPVVTWQLIIGPHNASLYYRLTNQDSVLIMEETAPPGSKWIFDCSAKNSIPYSRKIGPILRVYSNVAELSIERRKVVVIAVPIAVVIIIITICILKVYCFQSEKGNIKTMFDTTPHKMNFFGAMTTDQGGKMHISDNSLSRDGSSIYSIEMGIEAQTLTVLDEQLRVIETKDVRSNSLPTEWLRLKELDDND